MSAGFMVLFGQNKHLKVSPWPQGTCDYFLTFHKPNKCDSFLLKLEGLEVVFFRLGAADQGTDGVLGLKKLILIVSHFSYCLTHKTIRKSREPGSDKHNRRGVGDKNECTTTCFIRCLSQSTSHPN